MNRTGRTRAALAVTAVCAVGLAVPAEAIVRGERIAAATAPWAVSLQDPAGEGAAGSGHYCTGTAIGPRLVLTARHCTEWDRFHAGVVMTGSDDPAAKPGPKTRIARAWVPRVLDEPGAAMAEFGDVAVIETADDLGVPALPLVAPGTVPPQDTLVHAVGYGRASLVDSPKGETALLRRAAMRLYTRSQCSESDLASEPWAMCARPDDGPIGGLVASGDSGGGLIVEGPRGPEVIAVSVTATSGPMRDRVSGFASVDALRGFIASPSSGVELPRPQGVPRIAGTARVGRHVRCDVRFTPRPQRVEVSWYTVTGKRYGLFKSGAKGRKVPASARGARLSCAVVAWAGPDNPTLSDPSKQVVVR